MKWLLVLMILSIDFIAGCIGTSDPCKDECGTNLQECKYETERICGSQNTWICDYRNELCEKEYNQCLSNCTNESVS